ncbi:MAG TPA: hypothetical protein VIX86_13130 [Streptosporangiaceae bacterium]
MRYRLMATYRGVPYEAGVGPSNSDVVLFAACPPPEALGFEPATGHWRKQVIRAEIDALWESRPVGIFRGEPCIVLDDLGERLHIAYLGTEAERAGQLGYWQVDRGVFELLTPRDEVSGLTEERVDRPLRWSEPGTNLPQTAYPYGTAPWPVLVPPGSPPAPAPVPSAPAPEAGPPAGPAGVPASGAPSSPPGRHAGELAARHAGELAARHAGELADEPRPAAPDAGLLPAAPPAAGLTAAGRPRAGLLADAATGELFPGGPMPGGPMPGGPMPTGPAPDETMPSGLVRGGHLTGGHMADGPAPAGPMSPGPASAGPHAANGAWLPPASPSGLGFPPPAAANGLPAYPSEGPLPAPPPSAYPGPAHGSDPAGPPGPDPGGRAARRQRVRTREIFCELADLASIPRSAYALEIETDGAMCLLPTPDGFEVFTAADGARHEVRTFAEEEAAYFYLFGVLAAEAIRNGALAPSVVSAGLRQGGI